MEHKTRTRGLSRPAEVILALAGMIFLLPLFLAIPAVIKSTSKGTVFFRQRRIGRRGAEFILYKFRTMHQNSEGIKLTSRNDSRLTPVGRFLRQYKLDELPQLWNVLRGEMSFAGPRPEVSEYVDLNCPLWQEILAVRPGISDPVALKFRNEEQLLAEVEAEDAWVLCAPRRLHPRRRATPRFRPFADRLMIGRRLRHFFSSTLCDRETPMVFSRSHRCRVEPGSRADVGSKGISKRRREWRARSTRPGPMRSLGSPTPSGKVRDGRTAAITSTGRRRSDCSRREGPTRNSRQRRPARQAESRMHRSQPPMSRRGRRIGQRDAKAGGGSYLRPSGGSQADGESPFELVEDGRGTGRVLPRLGPAGQLLSGGELSAG